MAGKSRIEVLDQTGLDTQSAALDKAEGLKRPHYDDTTSIVLGVAGSEIVIQQFKIHKEIIENVFDAARMPTTSVVTNSIKSTKPASSKLGRGTSVTDDGLDRQIKNSIDKGFIGNMVRIPIPPGAAAKLHKFFNSTFPRKNVYIMFPKLATNAAIAMWIATHATSTYQAQLGVFYNQRGTKVSFDPTKYDVNDLPTISALVGKFSPAYAGRLANIPIIPAK